MADVRIIKFDVDSPTDKTLERLKVALHASSTTEAFRRGVAIADYVTRAQADGKKVLIVDANGEKQELIAG